MAKQKGQNPLSGSIGNLTYFIHPHYGPAVRARYGPSKERIENDPAYAPVKKSNDLLSLTSKGGLLIRECFDGIVKSIADSKVDRRIVGMGYKINKASKLLYAYKEDAGGHPYHTDAVKILKEFRFNETALKHILRGDVNLHREGDDILVKIKTDIKEISGVTHCIIASSLGAFDFEKRIYEYSECNSGLTEAKTIKDLEFSHKMFEGFPVHMMVVSVMCFQEVNGAFYRLQNKECKAAEVMEVLVN